MQTSIRVHRVVTLALLAASAFFVLPSHAFAQRWGRDRFPDSGACFFRDADYRGEYFCIRAGDDVGRLPDEMNDAISSIRMFGRAEVIVFRDVRFNGGSSRFASNVRNLREEGWNDRISSLRVQIAPREGGDFRDRDRRGDDRRGDRRISGDEADRIVRRAYQDLLHRDPDDAGLRGYRTHMLDDGWSEEQVRNSIRDSREFRERSTMTRGKAEDIVRRAYLNVLKREPDAAGSQGFINAVMRENWSQEDVEKALRNSEEYRNRRDR
jgi:hypothetical protein